VKILRKTFLTAAVLIGAGCVLPSASLAQGSPISDAYRQLRLLSSSTESGVSYNSFGEEWRKALGLVNIAIEDSPPSALTQKLGEIKNTYSDVSDLWSCRFSSKFVSVAIDFCISPGFKERNPEVVTFLKQRVDKDKFATMATPVEAAIPGFFGRASTQVRELGELLKTSK
jgi:hypothetical protein